jgi:beta-fructofuranosidase
MKKIPVSVLMSLLTIISFGQDNNDESIYELNYHLVHPGGESKPGDPNAAFYSDGKYHLHYIITHDWNDGMSFSYIHVTSKDMLHWEWEPTTLQPSFTIHGMFSGTGFYTKDGKPAIIYHGAGSEKNWIVIAKDSTLNSWNEPIPVDVKTKDGEPAKIHNWDPDAFLIGDTYYGISGGLEPPIFKSKDLKNWTLIGDFIQEEPASVAYGEDLSCANFFPIGDANKWMLLAISHPFGCRYYIGEWDALNEQFVPESHGRMNWRRKGWQGVHHWDFFAPESLLTPDGRRVMWAWLPAHKSYEGKTIQSLPRELTLAKDNTLRISPIRELRSLRYDEQVYENIRPGKEKIATLDGDAYEIRAVISREEAARTRFGFNLFSDGYKEEEWNLPGKMPIILSPETGTIQVGDTHVPFSLDDLEENEDLVLNIFIDKSLVEVFVNDRLAPIAVCLDYKEHSGLYGYFFNRAPLIKELRIWKIRPTNQGYYRAKANKIWEPDNTN